MKCYERSHLIVIAITDISSNRIEQNMKYLKNTFGISIENKVCIFIIILKLKSC